MKKQEFIEIVDKNNRPLGIKKEKLQAHLDGNWHRNTQIWVLNKKGEILVNQRSENQFQNPGQWASFFGGHLLLGESYFQGALREIEEELGLKIEKERLEKGELKKNPGPNEFVQIFILILRTDDKPRLSGEEIKQWRFVTSNKLLEWAKAHPEDFAGGETYIENQLKQLKRFKS